jgi:hypothetical protein
MIQVSLRTKVASAGIWLLGSLLESYNGDGRIRRESRVASACLSRSR